MYPHKIGECNVVRVRLYNMQCFYMFLSIDRLKQTLKRKFNDRNSLVSHDGILL